MSVIMLFFISFLFPSFFFFFFFFFFNDTATTEIYTLSLHDALPICRDHDGQRFHQSHSPLCLARSEEHTSELQSRSDLVCRLLLEKKKKKKQKTHHQKKKSKKKQQPKQNQKK